LPELIAPHRDGHDLDVGEFFLEIRQHRFVTADINGDLAFLLGGFERLFPFLLQREFP
jgi:hypothetical protein